MYNLEFHRGSADILMQCDQALRDQIVEHLLCLQKSPVTVSRRSVSPPFPPGYQMYPFEVVHLGITHFFTVLFLYGTDEETLHIYGIGHQTRS